MLVYEVHGRYIQSLISRTNGWNVIAFKNFVKNYGHIGPHRHMTMRDLSFCINVQLWQSKCEVINKIAGHLWEM
jgi:hypothetical protein